MKSTPRLARLPSISRIRRAFDPPKGSLGRGNERRARAGLASIALRGAHQRGFEPPCGVILGVRGGLLIPSAFNLEENVMTLHPN